MNRITLPLAVARQTVKVTWLFLACLATFCVVNALTCIGGWEDPSECLHFAAYGAIGAEACLYALWCVFAKTRWEIRLLTRISVPIILFGAGAVAFIISQPGHLRSGRMSDLVITFLSMPLLLLAVHIPLRALKYWFRWRITIRADNPQRKVNQTFGIRDLMIWTGAIGLCLAMGKLSSFLALRGDFARLVIESLAVMLVSTLTILPVVTATFRSRSLLAGLTGVLASFTVVFAGFISIFCISERGFPPLEVFPPAIALATSFTVCMSGPLVVARWLGYRLQWGRGNSNQAAEAIEEVKQAAAIRPKRRFGCLGCFAGCGAVLLVLLGTLVYWNFLRTPPFRISKETTYITEPLTSDGTRVDYFAALERSLYPPEMKTDDNGYRLIVRALGHNGHRKADDPDDVVEARAAQAYEKLGLDPAIKPAMTCITAGEFLREYAATEGLDEKQARELDVHKPWTLDDMPMMEPWLEDAGPVLDLVAEAVRKPAYCLPLVRLAGEVTFLEVGTFYDGLHFGDAEGTSQFAMSLQARANYRIGIGDIDGAIDDAITCQRLGRHVSSRGMTVSIAVEEIAASLGVAANRESQPTEEQLQRWVDDLNAIPPRGYTDRFWLDFRFRVLDNFQDWAMSDDSSARALSNWLGIELATAEYLTVDWNIVMRRVNELCDGVDGMQVSQRPPEKPSLGYLFIGVRSRHLGEMMAHVPTSAFHEIREVDRLSCCMGNLHRITLAMLIHERRHGTLPPAYTVDADGNPLHSWRALLLPYLGEEELFGKLRVDEPWDSQHNRRFHDKAVAVYQCPSAEVALGQTTYSVVVGQKTAFAAGEGKSLDDLGMNLILVVERKQPVCWMDPTSEVTEAVARKGINRNSDGVGSPHPDEMVVGFRDGSVRFIPATIELPALQGLLDGSAEDNRY